MAVPGYETSRREWGVQDIKERMGGKRHQGENGGYETCTRPHFIHIHS